MLIMPGPRDVLRAGSLNANYSYGPSLRQINQRMSDLASLGSTATITVT
jgi:hypothetical protein